MRKPNQRLRGLGSPPGASTPHWAFWCVQGESQSICFEATADVVDSPRLATLPMVCPHLSLSVSSRFSGCCQGGVESGGGGPRFGVDPSLLELGAIVRRPPPTLVSSRASRTTIMSPVRGVTATPVSKAVCHSAATIAGRGGHRVKLMTAVLCRFVSSLSRHGSNSIATSSGRAVIAVAYSGRPSL